MFGSHAFFVSYKKYSLLTTKHIVIQANKVLSLTIKSKAQEAFFLVVICKKRRRRYAWDSWTVGILTRTTS